MKWQFYFLSYVDAILIVWRCIQRKLLIFNFQEKSFMWQGQTQVRFLKNISLNISIFINKPPCLLEVVVLIFLLANIFQRNENTFIRLVLQGKQQKAIQQPYIFLKFYKNQFSNQFLLFFSYSWFMKLVVIYYLPDIKVI